MGSPVSAVKANIYVEDLRKKLWYPRLARLRSANALWMTSLVSPRLERFSFSFPEKPQKNLHLKKTIYCCATMRQRAITD